MKRTFLLFFALLWSCATPPAEPTRPFIEVTLAEPDGFVAPVVDTLEIFSTGLVDGQQLSSTSTADVSGNPLPTDFVLLFSERARGASVDIRVRGLLAGVDMFTATATATAGTSQVTAIVRFCGDAEISADRQEQCDDANQDETDDCLNSCQDASCGDGFVLDGVEECDDGNLAAGDGCSGSCQQEECGDGFVNNANGEECDDGNNVSGDGCDDICVDEFCGDGQVNDTTEECDDGGILANDGCDAQCGREFVVQISAGDAHTCALLSTGNVRCWGDPSFGRLGYGNTTPIGGSSTPASVGDVNVGGSVAQISAGGRHTCALLTTGNVRCWGFGSSGQLGYQNTNSIGDDETPASAGDINVGGDVLQISAGFIHMCALLTTGDVRCWGEGSNGRLGYGNTNDIGDDETPASAGNIDVGGTVTQISANEQHTCALLGDGNVRCWGEAVFGRLGYGNAVDIGDDETPASVSDLQIGGTAVGLSQGISQHNCALLNNGNVRCWGNGADGSLGYGNVLSIGDDEVPSVAGDVNVGGVAVDIMVGGRRTCSLLDSGQVRCWGRGLGGVLGYGNVDNIGDNETPASAGSVDVGGLVSQLSVGGGHTCVLFDSGFVRCWGSGFFGALGYGNTDNIGDDETPASVGFVPIF